MSTKWNKEKVFRWLSYYGSQFWNSNPQEYKQYIEYNTKKAMITKWEGPNCGGNFCSILTVIIITVVHLATHNFKGFFSC